MTSADSTFAGMQSAAREIVRVHSGLFLAQGVIMTLLGIAAVVWPSTSIAARGLPRSRARLLQVNFRRSHRSDALLLDEKKEGRAKKGPGEEVSVSPLG